MSLVPRLELARRAVSQACLITTRVFEELVQGKSKDAITKGDDSPVTSQSNEAS